MTPQQRERVEHLCEEAVAARPSDLAGWLAARCTDPQVVSEVESLLTETQSVTVGPPKRAMPALAQSPPPVEELREGDRIGPHRVLGLLGEGGMGAVYRAVRDDDEFHKMVAIKVVRAAARSQAALQRFRRERQILAELEHPHIARLLDGGTTAAGSPYIVMEYIQGEPITVFCAKLPIPERLKLFRKVCGAVQHAHQRLIVHRDIKPGNILVAADGEPKLLDFGIAKLLEEEGEDGTAPTMTALCFTPDYASPEQVRGEPVSAATDVYALGAVLFELLTGQRAQPLGRYHAAEIIHQICESETRPPSAVGGPRLRGDLDNIVLKAMQKETARRYNSAEQLSEDIRRYLDGLPVMARPDTLLYRAGKFARRNRIGLAAVTAVILALAGGGLAALHQARMAQQRFQQVRNLANRFLFDFHDEIAKVSGTTKARHMVVTTALEYLDNLSRSAGGDAGLLHELAQAYQKVGHVQGSYGLGNLFRPSDAKASFDKSLSIDRTLAASDTRYRPGLAGMLSTLSNFERDRGETGAAVQLARESVEVAELVYRQHRDELSNAALLGKSYTILGRALQDSGDVEAARQAFQTAHPYTREAARNNSAETIHELHLTELDMADAAGLAGFFEESLQALSTAEATLARVLRSEPANPKYRRGQQVLLANIAGTYDDAYWPSLNRPEKALDYRRKLRQGWLQRAAADPADADARIGLAVCESEMSLPLLKSAPAEAVAAARRGLAIFDEMQARNPGDGNLVPRRARALTRLAWTLLATGNSAEASRHAAESVAVHRQLLSGRADDRSTQRSIIFSLSAAAEAQQACGRTAAAESSYQEAIRMADRVAQYQPPQLGYFHAGSHAYQQFARHCLLVGRSGDARNWFQRDFDLWNGWPKPNPYVTRRLKEAAARLQNLK